MNLRRLRKLRQNMHGYFDTKSFRDKTADHDWFTGAPLRVCVTFDSESARAKSVPGDTRHDR